MHGRIKAHISIDNDNFVNNSGENYKPIIRIRKDRSSNFHSNFPNLKEDLVLLFTIFSIALPIGIQPGMTWL
jgi:hypothetical protein